jgi:hypothetical protein
MKRNEMKGSRMTAACKFVVKKTEGKKLLEDLSLDVIIIYSPMYIAVMLLSYNSLN